MAGHSTVDDLAFCGSPETTIGIELEVPLLDRETGELAPGSTRVLAACQEESIEGVSAELMQSMLEVRTGICNSVIDVRSEITERLSRVRRIARSLGYDIALLATHPSATATEHVLFAHEHYQNAEERMGWMIYHRVTFGLHVHVGVSSGDEAIGMINMLVQNLPPLIALSANSPFWQGIDTGLASVRTALYGMVPHAGVPGCFEHWKEFCRYMQVMQDCKALRSPANLKWDIRPRPELGTIEVRICDTPASLADAFALAALVRHLVASTKDLLGQRPHLTRGDVKRQWITTENKWLATRFGLDATYIRSSGDKRRTMRHEVNDLIDRLLPAAAASGEDRFLAHLRPLALFKNGADRQRQLYRETGDWQAIVTDAVARLGDELEPPRDSHALRVSA